jgi:predicted DNA-binding ribbon-helix-helix protein
MLIKKSITIKRHRTSVSLEKEFWDGLNIISKEKKISVEKLILNIDVNRKSSLASSIRVFVLQYYLK